MSTKEIIIRECEGAYPPREDSYLLLDSIETGPGEKFLDIGTGTGIIAIAAAKRGAEVFATDISENAVKCAKRNAYENKVSIEILRTNLADGIKGRFDVVSFNAPYLPESEKSYGDMAIALESGKRGSFLAEEFVKCLPFILAPDGRAYLVLSSMTDHSFMKGRKDMLFKEIARKHIFFEDIFVFMLMMRKDL